MQPKVQLSIPQPCHEDWHKMTPSQQGRFCNACAKQVVDFTTMSDTEVLHYFLDKQGEKVCGRMYPDQLNRPVTKPVYPVKKKLWQWNYAAMFLLFLSKSFGAKAQGAVKIIKTEQVPPVSNVELRGTLGMVAYKPFTKIIRGKITDKDGVAVAGASVQIKGTKTGTVTDVNGTYSIKVKSDGDILQVSAVGYETQAIKLKTQSSLDIVLTTLDLKLQGDVLVTVGDISSDYDYYPPANPKHVAVIEVRDNASHLPVKASIVITKNSYKTDSVVTDAKGIYNLKKIKENDRITLTINATGYLPSAMEIKGWSFNERKETKYVFLEKEPKLADYKKMDTVKVNNYPVCILRRDLTESKASVMGATVSAVMITTRIADTVSLFKTKLTGTLKIAPNPVAKGNTLTISYSTKQSGNYLLQVINGAGQLMLQKKLSAMQKNNTVLIQTGVEWSSGVYYIRISDAKTNLLSTNSFIVH